MTTYSIGQVEEITGVRQHILRYWEEVIPAFAPKKDFGGRRVYTQKDIEAILRLKHLVYQKKFTIEGARDQIIRETDLSLVRKTAASQAATALSEIQKIRSELVDSFFILRKYRRGLR